jgi:hypothetical protein
MKRILTSILSISLIMGIQSTVFSQKTEKEIKSEIREKASKNARKEAKKYQAEGWDVAPGSLPLEKLIEKSWTKQLQENDKGEQMYIFADGNGVANTKSAAEMQALELGKIALASQIESKVSSLLTASVGNNQINKDDAATISEVIQSSKNIIATELGYVEPSFKIYRTPKNTKNVEVQVRLFYNVEQSMQITKKVIQKELRDKLKVNEEQLNKAMGLQ